MGTFLLLLLLKETVSSTIMLHLRTTMETEATRMEVMPMVDTQINKIISSIPLSGTVLLNLLQGDTKVMFRSPINRTMQSFSLQSLQSILPSASLITQK